MSRFTLSYETLCDILFDKNTTLEEFLRANYPLLSEDQRLAIHENIKKSFVPHFNQRLKNVSRNKAKFFKKYSDWMKCTFEFQNENLQAKNKGGRPKKSFEECGKRAKNYKIRKLRQTNSQPLINAASSRDTPKSPSFDVDTALALITEAKLSKYQYEILRQSAKDIGHDIYPSYKKVIQSKQNCYPKNLVISESSAKVPLQDLLDHTAKRIIESNIRSNVTP